MAVLLRLEKAAEKFLGLLPQSQSAPGLIIGKELALLVYPGAVQPHLLEAYI